MKHLVCPGCGHGDELHLLEDVRVERKIGEVMPEHTEYLDLDPESQDNFREVGVTCRCCGFTYKGENWKQALKGVVNETA
jgi:protein-arginine kinase activator protein McsA